jgi:predicted nucleic acid-binding protein
VFKKLLLETTEDDALLCIAHMKQGNTIDLNRLVRQPGWLSHKSCKMLHILRFLAEVVRKLKFPNNSNDELSLLAAKLSIEFKLPMADSVIYATALKYNCILWTQDHHFSGLNFVNYFEKR